MAKIYIQVGQSVKSDQGIYYKVLEFLGSGANAFAYRCLCTSGYNRGMEFVLKIQYNLATETRRERFLRESAFLSACNHPAILRQYDYGMFTTSQEKFPFIITNYMPENLAGKISSGTITFESKVKYSCQLLSAVSFLQSQNIVHRDIKPNNIFISNDNAVLGDFGLIKKLDEEKIGEDEDDVCLVNETVMNNFSGYAAMAKYYRTPELVNYANHVDVLHIETDIFQLGLVLTELFTGKNPLRPCVDLRDPLELDDIGYIDVPNDGRIIHDTLVGMLQKDYRRRININLVIDRFTGIYTNIATNREIH